MIGLDLVLLKLPIGEFAAVAIAEIEIVVWLDYRFRFEVRRNASLRSGGRRDDGARVPCPSRYYQVRSLFLSNIGILSGEPSVTLSVQFHSMQSMCSIITLKE